MANLISYEWWIEWRDCGGETIYDMAGTTFKDLLHNVACSQRGWRIKKDMVAISLVRDVWNEFDDLVNRQQAYITTGGKLPSRFNHTEDSVKKMAKVSKKYISEFEKEWKLGSTASIWRESRTVSCNHIECKNKKPRRF